MVTRIKDLNADPAGHVHKDTYTERFIEILLIILKF